MIKFKRFCAFCLVTALLVCSAVSVGAAARNATNEKIVYDFVIKNLGLSQAAACGIMANMYGESGFLPAIENGYGYVGICQWGGVRRTYLEDFCEERGLDYKTLGAQLQFMKYELESYEYRSYKEMKNVENTRQGAYDAGYLWQQYFERGPAMYREIYAKYARDIFWPEYGVATHSGTCYSLNFYDVGAAWYHADVDYMLQRKLMAGTGTHTFSPNSSTSRAQMVAIMHRIAGVNQKGGNNPFSDVPNGKWYTEDVKWAAHNGIVAGMPDGRFYPDMLVSREQAAVMLQNFAKYLKKDTSQTKDISSFIDARLVSEYAKPALSWAVGTGIISGSYIGGTVIGLQSYAPATRAQICSIFHRFLNYYSL